jgi:hypothetical protein
MGADEDREGNYVETYTGTRFYPFDPRPEEVALADIAAGLAHTCRFGGHCRTFYSVALHSVHVSRELAREGRPARVQLYGLLHDAGEAYVGDVPRPVKDRFEGFDVAEGRILDAVWAALSLRPPTESEWAAVMAADDRLLAYEADHLLADGSWAADPPDADYELDVADPAVARERFAARARDLLDAVEAATVDG